MHQSNGTRGNDTFCVLICAYNESEHIERVVHGVLAQHPARVLVVDDGSTDNTAVLAQQAGADVVRNEFNEGKGAALRVGFQEILDEGYGAVIVVDGDGQHDPSEIPRFLDAYKRTGIPVLIGNRMAGVKGMPLIRRQTNRTMAWFLNRLVKIYIPDPPCGFRFYRTDVLPFIMSQENRFAFEFDILIHAALRRVRIDSVRISTIYNRHKKSHVSPVRDAFLFFGIVRHHFLVSRIARKAEFS